jgi:hypothetical protein
MLTLLSARGALLLLQMRSRAHWSSNSSPHDIRRHLTWADLQRSCSGDGHRGGRHSASIAMAERLCRTHHRLDLYASLAVRELLRPLASTAALRRYDYAFPQDGGLHHRYERRAVRTVGIGLARGRTRRELEHSDGASRASAPYATAAATAITRAATNGTI